MLPICKKSTSFVPCNCEPAETWTSGGSHLSGIMEHYNCRKIVKLTCFLKSLHFFPLR